MVAKTPIKSCSSTAAAIDPTLLRETLRKVDRCVARLQELQYTVADGKKVVAGVSLSPRSTRGYLSTSLRCKQESIRMKNSTARKLPPGKLPAGNSNGGEWRRMSLPAMLIEETVKEIIQANEFAKEIIENSSKPNQVFDPKTPDSTRRKKRPAAQSEDKNTQLRIRRTKEKQRLRRTPNFESNSSSKSISPVLHRSRTRINFKPNNSPPINQNNFRKPSVSANRVSPKNRPWAKKTVLFPNPLFVPQSTTTSPLSHNQRFYKTRSPVIVSRSKQRTSAPPHKFLIKKAPNPSPLKAQFESKKAVPAIAPAATTAVKQSPLKLRRCSFSPAKLANRLVSPLKKQKNLSIGGNNVLVSGLKQRPVKQGIK